MRTSLVLTELPDRIQKFLVQYAINIQNVILFPRATFSPDNPSVVAADTSSVLKALGFASLSLALSGILWQAFAPASLVSDKIAILLFLLLSWVIFSCMYFAIARLLGGTAGLIATLQTALIVKSVLYLLAVFVTVGLLTGFTSNPAIFAQCFILLYEISCFVFLSIGLSTLNRFPFIRSAAFSFGIFLVTLIPVAIFYIGLLFYDLSNLNITGRVS